MLHLCVYRTVMKWHQSVGKKENPQKSFFPLTFPLMHERYTVSCVQRKQEKNQGALLDNLWQPPPPLKP